ncbi:12924_t:CDS:2, partial [Ambispora gerdemannii]
LLSSAIKIFSQEFKTHEDSRSELSSLSSSECSTPKSEDLDNWPGVKIFDDEQYNELLSEYLKAHAAEDSLIIREKRTHVEKPLLIGEKQTKKVISTPLTLRKQRKNKYTLHFDDWSGLLLMDDFEDNFEDAKFLDNPFYENNELSLSSSPVSIFNHEETYFSNSDQYFDEEDYKIEDNRYNEECSFFNTAFFSGYFSIDEDTPKGRFHD